MERRAQRQAGQGGQGGGFAGVDAFQALQGFGNLGDLQGQQDLEAMLLHMTQQLEAGAADPQQRQQLALQVQQLQQELMVLQMQGGGQGNLDPDAPLMQLFLQTLLPWNALDLNGLDFEPEGEGPQGAAQDPNPNHPHVE